MKLYDDYIANIRGAVKNTELRKASRNSLFFQGLEGYIEKTENVTESFDFTPLNSLAPLSKSVGINLTENKKLGEHPDFKHLKNSNQSENHYITSVFIDIKNSTGLFRRYDLNTVRIITNTIQRAAIHTCVIFGGYIQRLQGDGVFVYFGGKNTTKKDSTINALNACSFFTYFVKYDLKNLFEELNIENIYTRIGIDFGYDEDVLWALAGIGECSEVTTYSLHTSLASKLQSIANSNGIVVGENVHSISEIEENYFDLVKDSKDNVKKRYIFVDNNDNFYYKALDFKWFKYLQTLPFIISEGNELKLRNTDLQDKPNKLEHLKEVAALINTGQAYTDQKGNITENPNKIVNQPHRFHYGK